MKKYSNYKLLCSLFFLSVSAASCQGQPNIKGAAQTAVPANHTRIVKTRSTNKYSGLTCGMQDKAGNMWFATGGEGVYRYDGKSFTNFTEKDGLSSNTVYCVLEDKAGNIWFGTSAGLCRYNPLAAFSKGEEMFTGTPFRATDQQNFYPNIAVGNTPSAKNEVWSMLQDKTGKIWIGTNIDGVYCYDGTTFTHFLDNENIVNKEHLHLNQVRCMMEDKSGNIWFTGWFEGMCRYDGKSLTSFRPNGKVWFSSVFEDSKGNLWFGTRDNGAYCYGPSATARTGAEPFTSFSDIPVFGKSCVYAIKEDKAGNIWFAVEADDITERETTGGAWRYDGKTFKNYTTGDGLKDNTVFSITIDRSGTLWFGTRNIGLCSYDGKTVTDFSDEGHKQ